MYTIRWHKGLGQYARGEFATPGEVREFLIWLRNLKCEAAVYLDDHQVGAVVPSERTLGRWQWWLRDSATEDVA